MPLTVVSVEQFTKPETHIRSVVGDLLRAGLPQSKSGTDVVGFRVMRDYEREGALRVCWSLGKEADELSEDDRDRKVMEGLKKCAAALPFEWTCIEFKGFKMRPVALSVVLRLRWLK